MESNPHLTDEKLSPRGFTDLQNCNTESYFLSHSHSNTNQTPQKYYPWVNYLASKGTGGERGGM